jgi:hypothetical protein
MSKNRECGIKQGKGKQEKKWFVFLFKLKNIETIKNIRETNSMIKLLYCLEKGIDFGCFI